MAADLRARGYKRGDMLRVYGFNLILAPVNLSGVIVSVGQGLTGWKIAFARTHKVRDRTTARLLLVVVPYLLVAWSAWTLWHDVERHRWAHAVFACGNALLALYGTVAFIGVRNSLVDVGVNLVDKLYRPAPRPSKVRAPRPAPGAETGRRWRLGAPAGPRLGERAALRLDARHRRAGAPAGGRRGVRRTPPPPAPARAGRRRVTPATGLVGTHPQLALAHALTS